MVENPVIHENYVPHASHEDESDMITIVMDQTYTPLPSDVTSREQSNGKCIPTTCTTPGTVTEV